VLSDEDKQRIFEEEKFRFEPRAKLNAPKSVSPLVRKILYVVVPLSVVMILLAAITTSKTTNQNTTAPVEIAPPRTIEGRWVGVNKTIDVSADELYSDQGVVKSTSSYLVKVSLEGQFAKTTTMMGLLCSVCGLPELSEDYINLRRDDGRDDHLTYSANRDVISYDGEEFKREKP
jgi:hypothetical protein